MVYKEGSKGEREEAEGRRNKRQLNQTKILSPSFSKERKMSILGHCGRGSDVSFFRRFSRQAPAVDRQSLYFILFYCRVFSQKIRPQNYYKSQISFARTESDSSNTLRVVGTSTRIEVPTDCQGVENKKKEGVVISFLAKHPLESRVNE